MGPAEAMLALMDNTVAARRDPAWSMPILRQAVGDAHAFRGPRGDSTTMVQDVLHRLAW
jgi:hypothetical protein